MEFLQKLFESDFMPHGHCYYWKPEIVWTNAFSDGVIALAYMTIPISLVHIVRSRKDFKFYWMLVLFAMFILGCGATHVMDVINIWNPIYRLDSSIRVLTALASVGTAIMLVKITPQVLSIPNTENFRKVNEELKNLNLQLEEKVQQRTEQLRKSEEILRQKESQLRLITNSIPAFISYVDKDLIYRFANDSYKTIHFNESEVIDLNMKSVLGNEIFEKREAFIKKALEGESVSFETDKTLKNGSLKHLNVTYIPDRDENDKVRGFVVMGIDMTERIAYEKSLEGKNEELIRINNDLDNFIYTASHDLKAPISNMEGLLYTIYSERDKDITNLLDMMKLSIDRLRETINDLTEISQMQKETDLKTEQILIPTIIEEFQIDYNNQIQENEARIIMNLQIKEITFSRKNFRSVIYNLLNNAIKYRRPEVNPEIQIKTEIIEKNTLLLSVSDNGLGIEENQKPRIFEMFKRMHTHVEGTGIGLYIVKRIIENAGGKIEVESESGKGSTFKIFFKQNSE